MIITCPNCNKQFKIDNYLIPDEGRDLQCGSCNHVWFYKIEVKNNDVFKLNEEIISKDIETKEEKKEEKIEEKKQSLKKIKTVINDEKKEKISEKQKNKTSIKNTENKGNKFFSYLIVFIISFVALIILLDTLKNPFINVFPQFEIILFNLFETLQDIKLFIIDLI
ncbi:zinc-ribbon domain-containing protein [Candidatus Pelagibacter sp.]|nr:zinc-ribbon domain-containing protein [Candidatus Pelagibacter sp.]